MQISVKILTIYENFTEYLCFCANFYVNNLEENATVVNIFAQELSTTKFIINDMAVSPWNKVR